MSDEEKPTPKKDEPEAPTEEVNSMGLTPTEMKDAIGLGFEAAKKAGIVPPAEITENMEKANKATVDLSPAIFLGHILKMEKRLDKIAFDIETLGMHQAITERRVRALYEAADITIIREGKNRKQVFPSHILKFKVEDEIRAIKDAHATKRRAYLENRG